MAHSTSTLNIWQRLCYALLFGVVYAVSLLPLRALYVLSDVLCLLAYRVVGYRRALVRRHLADCFPERSAAERLTIERDFYRWLGDYIVETVKLFSMSPRQMRRRMVFSGADVVDDCIRRGQDVALYLGHYCNWEWVSSIPLWLASDAGSYAGSQVFHVLENPIMDKLMRYPRHRMGADNVPMAGVLRYIAASRRQGRPVVMGFIADQVPFWNNIGHWLDFMNHPQTPVLTGTETLARRFGMACVYIDIRRTGRGCYRAEFQLMTTQPGTLPEHALTEDYFARLQDSIRRQPHLWLWTHNRWKRTREEYDRRVDPATGRIKL